MGETAIDQAITNKHYLADIFMDFEKAYNLIWGAWHDTQTHTKWVSQERLQEIPQVVYTAFSQTGKLKSASTIPFVAAKNYKMGSNSDQ